MGFLFKSVVKGSNKSAWNPGHKSLINLIGKLSSPLHSFGFNFLAAFLISLGSNSHVGISLEVISLRQKRMTNGRTVKMQNFKQPPMEQKFC